MIKTRSVKIEGEIIKLLPSGRYLVVCEHKQVKKNFDCGLSGRMRLNHIRVIVGDKVRIKVPLIDPRIGSIVYRNK